MRRAELCRLACVLLATALAAGGAASSAVANPAPIHIAKTDGQGVYLRPTASTSGAALGWMPEGASPDYHCFAWGESISGVPIWFNVTYNGVTGFYASYFDDSSYQSNEELTAKYGVPLCGASPTAGSAPGSQTPPAPPSGGGRAPENGVAVYYSPYERGKRELSDGSVKTIYKSQFANGCTSSLPAYRKARAIAGGRPISTLAGWSAGRVGVVEFLKRASSSELSALDYVLLIDPGEYGEMTCDRDLEAGRRMVRWLVANQEAHLVVISGTQVSQKNRSKGIQESYFNAIREASAPPRLNLRPRVLTCNYNIDHQRAFRVAQYWIAHRIGSDASACPWLSEGGETFKPTAGWHP